MVILYWLVLRMRVDHYRIALRKKAASPGSSSSVPDSVLGLTYSAYVCVLGVPVIGEFSVIDEREIPARQRRHYVAITMPR